jgi:hypothetical protein
MSFIAATEILGATALVRMPTIANHPQLPDGTYALVDTYCTDPGCDCRKTMILVHLDRRHVSSINFGWESPEFYARWYGAPLDDRTLAEMKGPSIDLNSPDGVPPGAMLAFFSKLLDAQYIEHLRLQYTRFRAALATPAGAQRLAQCSGGGGDPKRSQPCPCGSGRKLEVCCGRSR